MRYLFLTVFSLWTAMLPELEEVRSGFKLAIDNSSSAEALYDQLSGTDKKTPVLYAYRGATRALMAKHSNNPYTKLEYVKEGSEILDQAVIANPNAMEIRYLRYTMESNVPNFLPYRKHVEQDKSRILTELLSHPEELDPWLKTELAAYMLKNAQIDSDIRAKLQALLN